MITNRNELEAEFIIAVGTNPVLDGFTPLERVIFLETGSVDKNTEQVTEIIVGSVETKRKRRSDPVIALTDDEVAIVRQAVADTHNELIRRGIAKRVMSGHVSCLTAIAHW